MAKCDMACKEDSAATLRERPSSGELSFPVIPPANEEHEISWRNHQHTLAWVKGIINQSGNAGGRTCRAKEGQIVLGLQVDEKKV